MKSREIIFTTIVSLLVYFAFSPQTRAACDSPDPGCPGGNLAEGYVALTSLTSGAYNTGIGAYSLLSLTDGNFCTGVGAGTLLSNTADENTATGAGALLSNTTGSFNTATGVNALVNNTSGSANTATGRFALSSNTTGTGNVATGFQALGANTDGNFNIATGPNALFHNQTGNYNTVTGTEALYDNTTGSNNIAVGSQAGHSITGSGNVCIGEEVLGEAGVDDRTYIRNINTTTQSFSAGVNDYVTVRLTDGRLGHTQVVFSRRYKEEIRPLAAASEALYALKPVSFRLKKEYDGTRSLCFGLIAEEVEKVDPTLVYRNHKGQVESVRYEMVNAMLLNEFLKEHRKNEEQEKTIAELKSGITALAATVKEQAAQIQIVSAQLEANKPAPQVVNNP